MAKEKVSPKAKPKAPIRRFYVFEVPMGPVPVIKVFQRGEELEGVKLREIPNASSLAEALSAEETWAERHKKLVADIKAAMKETIGQWNQALNALRSELTQDAAEVYPEVKPDDTPPAPPEPTSEAPTEEGPAQPVAPVDPAPVPAPVPVHTPAAESLAAPVADLQKAVGDFTRTVDDFTRTLETLREVSVKKRVAAGPKTRKLKK